MGLFAKVKDNINRKSTRKPNIFDVAKWFLSKEPMTLKKLQILCYYAQAWSQALWRMDIARGCDFEAWVQNPTNVELHTMFHQKGFSDFSKIGVSSLGKQPYTIGSEDIEFLELVWGTYGGFSDNELEVLSQSEHPWRKARWGKKSREPSRKTISKHDMREYYRFLYEQEQRGEKNEDNV